MSDDLNDHAMPVPATASPQARPVAFAQGPPPPRLLKLVRKHQRTVLSCLGAALLLGALAQLLLPRSYESRAQIYVEEQSPDTAAARLTGPAGLPSTHAALLKTTPVLRAALASDAVRDLPSIAQRGEGAIEHLEKKLRTDVPPGGETVDVRYRSRSAQDAATVLTEVIQAYLAQLKADRGVQLAEPADPAAPRVMGGQMMTERLSELAGRLAQAEADTQQAATRLAQADAAGDDALALAVLVDGSGADSQLLGAAELAYLATELKKLEQQLESMPASWGPEHTIRGPIQRRADAMRHEVNTQNDQVAHTMLTALDRSHAAAERHARDLARAFEDAQAAAIRAARPPVRVIQWPEVPRRAAAPRALRTLGLAVFGGLGLALALVLRREVRDLPEDAPVYTPPPAEPAGYALGDGAASPVAPLALLSGDTVEDFSAQQGAPLLGQMPEVPRALTGGGEAPVFDDPAASIHQIRAVLQVQATATGMRAFAFTSPRRGAGKTSVALGVASSLALSGTRTLVVDCDLAGRIARNQAAGPEGPDIHPDDLPLSAGCPQGITGMMDGKPLAECVVASATQGLSLLPAVNPSAAHISKISDAFIRQVIDASRDAYDLVIFDTGPVPGSVEALLVASQCDGVIVIVPQGEERRAMDRTMSYLKVVGANVLGTVFNRVAPDDDAAGLSEGVSRPGAVPLGSGILAAAVFSDASTDSESDADDEITPKPSSDVDPELADVFGAITGDDLGDPL